MNSKEMCWWDFNADINDNSKIKCHECKEVSSISEWTESEVYCELCGEHSAIKCPKCDERFDMIGSPVFEVFKGEI